MHAELVLRSPLSRAALPQLGLNFLVQDPVALYSAAPTTLASGSERAGGPADVATQRA